jgi:predicted ATP-binding protein involved in virulence
MNYWHMQLHPDDMEWGKEKELLEKKELIGLGLTNDEITEQFLSKMKVDDIVFIKRGSEAIALVKVLGDTEDIGENDLNSIDWFRFRRKVKILDWAKNEKAYFSSPEDSEKEKNKNEKNEKTLVVLKEISEDYSFVESWYYTVLNRFYENNEGFKLRKIYIENYKMFKNLSIEILYPENIEGEKNPIPIIVFAGVNGTGKTTILEHISNFAEYAYTNPNDKSFIEYEEYVEEKRLLKKMDFDTSHYIDHTGSKKSSNPFKPYNENVVYLKFDKTVEDIKDLIVKPLEEKIFNNSQNPLDAYEELKTYIKSIFSDLGLTFEFSHIAPKGKGKEVFFKNSIGTKFPIDELSTGEKTILAKALYLYLAEIKNKVVLIDEPELSLHPSWQNKILKVYETFAKENNCQIIIATHSPHIIGSAKNEYLRLLKFNDENNVEVVSDLTAYGREITWVLEEVMGVEYTREKNIKEKIVEIEKLLDAKKYDDAEKQIEALENLIGKNDRDLVRLRTVLDFNKD